MKVSNRQIRNDLLSFEHCGYRVFINAHGNQKLEIQIEKNGTDVMREWMTPEQFISLLLTNTGR